MAQDEALLTAVQQWYLENSSSLAAERVKVTLRTRSTSRSKNSVSIDFETVKFAVSAVFWDSGESEVISASKLDLGAPVVNLAYLASVDDVISILNKTRESLLGGSS